MQDYAERQALLKQIGNELAEIQKIEDEIAKIRLDLSNRSRRFMISSVAMRYTSLIAFRQRLGKLSDSYLDLEAKTYDLMQIVDKIQP